MGIDLNFIVEIKLPDGRWQWRGGRHPSKDAILDEPYFIPRNPGFYRLFERRGRPADLSQAVELYLRRWFDDEPGPTVTWLTLRELMSMARLVPGDLRYLYDPLVSYMRGLGFAPRGVVRLILLFS